LIVLSGGTGTPKLLVGLKEVLNPPDLTVVANTADDLWISGNLVSPDLDTVVYTLAGLVDRSRWWGIENDSFRTSEFLKSLGHEEVLTLGDMDRAVHIFRSDLMRSGVGLSKATEELCRSLGVRERVVPMTDDPVSTMISTPQGEMDLQTYWVKKKGRLSVEAIRFRGIEEARPSSVFMNALSGDDPVLIGPSNPVTSIGPILALESVREMMNKKDRVIAVSPLVGDRPVSGPAAEFMRAWGYPVTDRGVADLLGCVDLMVVGPKSEYKGSCVRMNTTMNCEEDSVRLARDIVELISCS